MTSASFLNVQNALITIYQPIIYVWLILFLAATIGIAVWILVARMLKQIDR